MEMGMIFVAQQQVVRRAIVMMSRIVEGLAGNAKTAIWWPRGPACARSTIARRRDSHWQGRISERAAHRVIRMSAGKDWERPVSIAIDRMIAIAAAAEPIAPHATPRQAGQR